MISLCIWKSHRFNVLSKGKLHGGKVERNPGTHWSSGPAGFLRHLGSLEPLGSLGPSGPVN